MERREFVYAAGLAAAAATLPMGHALAACADAGEAVTVSLGHDLTPYAGRMVTIRGYVARPKAPFHHYVVLSARPHAADPACTTPGAWDPALVKVYPADLERIDPDATEIEVTGRLTLGGCHDAVTGEAAAQVIAFGQVRSATAG